MRDTLIILGMHPRTRNEFDWSRTDCDVMVFNEAMKADWVKRADHVLQIHLPIVWRNPANHNDPGHYEWLKSGNTPTIWMQEEYADVPKAKKYPLKEVIAIGRKYLTCSAAYAIGLGIYLGYERIEIYGVEMETGTEYEYQRPGVAYWIGVAEASGVTVDFHGSMLVSPLYGYESDIKFTYRYFSERIQELETSTAAAKHGYELAKQNTDAVISAYLLSGKEPDLISKAIEKQVKAGAIFGTCEGALREVKKYRDKADIQREAMGDHYFGRQIFEMTRRDALNQQIDVVQKVNGLAAECNKQFNVIKATANANKRKLRMADFLKTIEAYIEASIKVGICQGMADENLVFMRNLDELTRMTGGIKAEELSKANLQVLECEGGSE
jgi:hypothetical protein